MSKGKFEESIEQLEEIIEQIESGEIGLEDSITQYEKGTKLIEKCRAILDRAQARITELTVDGNGELKASGDAQND
ncbi:MAG: exodeoxyribonuclease VII small subunit [Phycisphaeraceae bacterium JB051]